MEWYRYLEAFFAGAFLANGIPHFVNGISGDKFPTPFSKPHGKGLSSSTINVVWALFNFLLGYILLRATKGSADDMLFLAMFFLGIVVISILLSSHFQNKEKNK